MATTPQQIDNTIRNNLDQLRKPGVVAVRPGFEFKNGWITGRPAVVALVTHKTPKPSLTQADTLPDQLNGLPVDVATASKEKIDQLTNPTAFKSHIARLPPEQLPPTPTFERTLNGALVKPTKPRPSRKTKLNYTAAPQPLAPITDNFKVTCAASPDHGWPTLKQFLTDVGERLTVGLYDFTAAHILHEVTTTLADKQVQFVLDDPPLNPTADQADPVTAKQMATALAHLNFAWALDDHNPETDTWIYPSAYHIKVAVADSARMWLSSGNWNKSNQPDIDPLTVAADREEARGRDRDWHVVIDHAGLSALFEAYLQQDFHDATPHSSALPAQPTTPPQNGKAPSKGPTFAQFFDTRTFSGNMTITPVLTPDPGIYVTAVKHLIDSATTSLYLQYQYMVPSPSSPQPFLDLIGAVVQRQHAGVDVKVILSEFQKRANLEELQSLGLDVVNNVKIQENVHNKGIVVDAQRVLVSSQNWSAPGVLENRDAGVIIDHADIANYYQAIFLHDWNTLAAHRLASELSNS